MVIISQMVFSGNFTVIRQRLTHFKCAQKLKNASIFHRNNTQSFIERIPFFRHVRLTKSFNYKESSVLSYSNLIAIENLLNSHDTGVKNGLDFFSLGRVSARLKIEKQKVVPNNCFDFLSH